MLKKRAESGFTLIETVMVVSIIFILITMFSWKINNWISYFRLKSDLRSLYSIFLTARQLAIMKQEPHGLIFEQNRFHLFSEFNGILKTKSLSSGIKFVQDIHFGNDNKMSFKPLGTAEGGNVTLMNNFNQKYKITVYSHTGRVRFIKNEE